MNQQSPPSLHEQSILLFAPANLQSKLAEFLQLQGYSVHATSNMTDATRILTSCQVALVLLHITSNAPQDAWRAYQQLHQSTDKPVLLISNIKATHFTENETAGQSTRTHVDLANYLRTVNLLWRTLVVNVL